MFSVRDVSRSFVYKRSLNELFIDRKKHLHQVLTDICIRVNRQWFLIARILNTHLRSTMRWDLVYSLSLYFCEFHSLQFISQKLNNWKMLLRLWISICFVFVNDWRCHLSSFYRQFSMNKFSFWLSFCLVILSSVRISFIVLLIRRKSFVFSIFWEFIY